MCKIKEGRREVLQRAEMLKRRERLVDLLDTALASVDDNPIYESYTSRNIYNYLQSLRIIDQMLKEDNYE